MRESGLKRVYLVALAGPFKSVALLWLTVITALVLGCNTTPTARVALKPVTPADEPEPAAAALTQVLAQLQDEEQDLEQQLLHLSRQRDHALARFCKSCGAQLTAVLSGTEHRLSVWLAQAEEPAVHAQEVARYAALIRVGDERQLVMQQTILETQSWARFEADVQALGGASSSDWPLAKATAIAEQPLDWNDGLSATLQPDETASLVHPLLEGARAELRQDQDRLAAQQRDEATLLQEQRRIEEEERQRDETLRLLAAERQREIEKQRADAVEAERQAVLVMARRQLEERHKQHELQERAAADAEAIKLFFVAYHAYFDGDYVAAIRDLDEAAVLGSSDPRFFTYVGSPIISLVVLSTAKLTSSTGENMNVPAPSALQPLWYGYKVRCVCCWSNIAEARSAPMWPFADSDGLAREAEPR